MSAIKSHAYELSGYVLTEGRYFFNDPLHDGQRRHSASLVIQPEFYHEWEDGSSLTFTPFARVDSADRERTHPDVRELSYLWLNEGWELRVGVGKVFWGVTEFVHLVDIINQTDAVENPDMEDKLGQPMIYLSVPREWGVIGVFVMPYFRERTFPGKKGRYRTEVVVDTDEAEYANPADEYHTDFAVRYSHTLGDWDFGIYYFNGTGREPTLLPRINMMTGEVSLIPFYEQIGQTGIDVQMVYGSWLFKLESLYRTGQGDDFYAAAGGFEYSFYNIFSSGMDVGLLGEWAYDERKENSTTGFDNDLMGGIRLAFNDAASTDALLGVIEDLDSDGRVVSLESSRRISDHVKITANAFLVLDSSEEDAIHSLRDDDSLQVELAYYF